MHIFHSSRPCELDNSTTLHDLGIETSGHCLKLAVDYSNENKFTLQIVNNAFLDDEQVAVMVEDVRIGLDLGRVPAKTDVLDSTGGVYFMRSSGNTNMAVFKPRDEEQGMMNNPKGYASLNGEAGLRPFFKPGYGCIRELAAFIFDVDNFCDVPVTTLVHCEHPIFNYPKQRDGKSSKLFPKLGSLQSFVYGEAFEDLGPSKLSDFEVQKIALLDLRILNCDRNSANIIAVRSLDSRGSSRSNSDVGLFGESSGSEFDWMDPKLNVVGGVDFTLVPIDHGYSFPPKLLINDYDWSWFHYPQLAKEVAPEIKAYINSLDIDAAIANLRKYVAEIPEEAIFLVRLSHFLLKEGISAGLTLKDIASLVARLDEGEPSKLEQVVNMAEDNALSNIAAKHAPPLATLLSSTNANAVKRPASDTPYRSPSLKRQSSLTDLPERDRSSSSENDDLSPRGSPVSVANTLTRSSSDEAEMPFRPVDSSDGVDENVPHVYRGSFVPTSASSSSTLRALEQENGINRGNKLARVASFSGFDSQLLDLKDGNLGSNLQAAALSRLRLRRQMLLKTNDFKQLKWQLASDAVRALITRTSKAQKS